MRLRPSVVTLVAANVAVMGIGLYFALRRPPLLPEDLRYLGRSLAQVETTTPALQGWLRHVFWVMGGYIFALGFVGLFLAVTAFRTRARGAALVVALAGAASVGVMAAVNFLIASDFRWYLLALASLWALAIALYGLEAGSAHRDRP